jgi:hypothetical protein
LPSTPRYHASRGWLRFGGAILFMSLVMSLVAGCASSGTGRSPDASAAAIGSPGATDSGAPSAASASAGPAATLLTAALKPLLAASIFDTAVSLDGSVVVSAKGRTLGDLSRLTVTTAGRSVEYIEIAPKAWARQGTGAWVLVAGAAAPVAPLKVLAAPLSLLAASGGTPGTFTATYPAKALGLTGAPLTVAISIVGDVLTFRYDATTAGHATSSMTTLRPGPADPIKAP